MFKKRMAAAGVVVTLSLFGLACGGEAEEDGVVFRDPLTNEPLQIELPEDASEAARTFFETGENPYEDDEEAIAEGRQLYNRWCASCHMPDGSGRIGPSLIDGNWKYERAATPVGQFEIIYAGATGAMQAFGDRLSPDEILKIIAYTDHLQEQRAAAAG